MCKHDKAECPEHEGGFDCTPFCSICEGEQEFCPICEPIIKEDKMSEATPKVVFEPCADCGATDMDEYACDGQREYCLDCCGCPEHIVDEHNPSWRD